MTANVKMKQYIHVVIMIAIAFIIGNLPVFGQITEYGMKATGLFIAAVYGWLFLNLSWTAFIVMFLLPVFGLATLDTLMVSGFSDTTLILIIVSYALFGVLNLTQIGQKLAGIVLNSKINQGRPWVFFGMITFAAWVCAFAMGGILALILLFPIVDMICTRCGYERFDKTSTILLIAVLIGSVLGGLTLPMRGMPLYLMFVFRTMYPAAAMSYMSYFLFTTVYTLLILFVFVLVCRFMLRVDLSKFHAIDVAELGVKDLTFTKTEKFVIAVIVATVGLSLITSVYKVGILGLIANYFGTFGIFLAGIFVLMVVPIEDGKPVATWQKLASAQQWDIIMTVIICVILTNAFASTEAGVVATITATLAPVLTKLPAAVFIVLLLFACMILTNFLHNGGTCIMCFPLAIAYAAVNPAVPLNGVIAALCICCHLALATPAASVYSQIAFGYEELIKGSMLTKYSFITLVPTTLIASLIAVPLMGIFF